LDPLLASWKRQRQVAHRELVDYFDSARYQRLLDKLGDFPDLAGRWGGCGQAAGRRAGAGAARVGEHRVLRYEAVPRLRGCPARGRGRKRCTPCGIECKYLRYTLEFFQEVLDHSAAG
jgi:CHAD domain-containing protein